MDIKKRLLRTLIIVAIGLSIGAVIGLVQGLSQQNTATVIDKGSTPVKTASIPGVQIGGPFALTDHNGNAVTEADYNGLYKLIYFGFTYCPAICPTELQKVSAALKQLDEARMNKIQPLFVTIDPERDTAEAMRSYVELFHPKLIGLTGTPEQIEKVKSDYRIFARKVALDDDEDYTMDHSSFIYLMSSENKVISIYRIKDDVKYMVQDITSKIPDTTQ